MREELHRWFTELRAIAQYGLTYSKNVYDLERFRQVESISSAIGARLTNQSETEVTKALALEVGPPCPKLDVRAAVFRDDAILLVREAADGLWSLPGGWVDVGDAPAQAAVREVKEETGLDCRATKLFGLLDRNQHGYPPFFLHCYKLLFLCDLLGGEMKTSVETTEVGFFELGELPPLSTSRTLPYNIERAFHHRAHPELPTDFD